MKDGDSWETAGDKSEEGGDDVKSAWPLCLGLHTCYNGRYKPSRDRKVELIGRGPLFKRQVLRSPALISACSKAGCYAVLASLSGRYPPLEGRSPTCYSPVRHSVTPCGATAFDLHVLGTPPALILSQDQTLKLKCLPAPHCCGHQRYLNVDCLLIGSLALLLLRVRRPAALANCTPSG